MMLAKRNIFISRLFAIVLKRILAKRFHEIIVEEIPIRKDHSVLLLCNHFSWWDGFLLFQLNRLFLHKKFHILVTEENYHAHGFLKYLGAFSVKKQSRSMIETLEYAGKLLNDPANLVVIFPQGKLFSSHCDEVLFEKGLMNIINSSDRKFQYLFVVLLVDYFQFKKPTAKAYLQTWEGAEFTSLQLIKSEYNKHYSQAKRSQNQEIV